MPKHLPIDERIETATQLVLRTRIFYDIWRFFEGAETRSTIIDTMNNYSEFFRFDPHSHFVAFIVHVAALYEKRKNNDVINLRQLLAELKDADSISPGQATDIDTLLAQADPLILKVIFLRSNLFAHRSAKISYADVFTRAEITPDDLRDLTEIALKVANHFRRSQGLSNQVFNTLPLAHAKTMLKDLAPRTMEGLK